MPVVGLSKSECEGFDPEVAECFATTEPIEFHDSAPKFATIKPTPIRPEPRDCVQEDKHAKEHELHVQLKDVLAVHDSAPKFATIKPTPIRPEPRDCVKEDKHAKEHELHVQLKDVLAEANSLRADLRDAGLRIHSLDMNNLHLQKQVRQLSDQKVSLGEQAYGLVKEVDMLKGKGLPAHVAGGEGVGLSQTTCSDHVQQSNSVLRHRKDNIPKGCHHELPRRNMSSNDDVISSSAHSSENNENVQRSNSFFSRLSKLFRRNKF
ncbi:uncharacterized protein LOC124114538 [Haliotis rufescens]|uniref:uncharacterized protein LOC124114538 n=1 Tax=Haliotis rufescens TaxID=6454 RepID=UPI00201F9EB6|nr:uncharacterized protein LOC124114538 [Haliotis rufescens]